MDRVYSPTGTAWVKTVELVEGGKLKAGEAALVELLVGELIEDDPKNTSPGCALCRWLGMVQRASGIEVAGLCRAPDQLPEDEQTAEGEEAKNASGSRLYFIEEGQELLPSKGGGEEEDKGGECNDRRQPGGDFSVGEVGVGVEKD